MQMDKGIIYEYEGILLGKKSGFSSYFFTNSDASNEQIALDLIRYAIKVYLRWTPEQVRYHFTWDIVHRLRLESVIKYVRFPPESDEKNNLYILAGKLYPDAIKVDVRELTLLTYKRVLNGDLYKFPKGFFLQNKGINRAIICFQYMLSQYTSFANVKDMYAFFATPKGTKLLKDYKLNAAAIAMFEHPIDFLHVALPPDLKNQLYYNYYRFKISNNEQIRKMKNAKTFIA